jgi:pilus assembly protein Flp/PilA
MLKNMAIAVSCKNRLLTHNDSGQTMAEYGLILALVALAAIVAWTTLGGNINTVITKIAGSI